MSASLLLLCLILQAFSHGEAVQCSCADGYFLASNEKSCHSKVFLDSQMANQVFNREKRSNTFFEELKQGNMERECIEERCSWEEAREIFENKEKTDEFWTKYIDGDACIVMPCFNGGQCKDGVGSYTCTCQEGYYGFNCEIDIVQGCDYRNGFCEHFCNIIQGDVQCSCADGYFLASNNKSCHSNETYKCGAIISKSIRAVFQYERTNTTKGNTTELNTNVSSKKQLYSQDVDPVSSISENRSMDLAESSNLEKLNTPELVTITKSVSWYSQPGQCPWQALLVNEDEIGFCGGTILNENIILTAANCMNQSRYFNVRLGEFDKLVDDGHEVDHYVEAILTHRGYIPDTYHNDIALIKLTTPIKFTRFILPACIPEQDFAEKVLMQELDGMVSGFGSLGEGQKPSTMLQCFAVPYVDSQTCMESTQFRLSDAMFCAGYDREDIDSCHGDGGGPHVTRYRDTYFITGIKSWGESCSRKGKYAIYTQVSKYIQWIHDSMMMLMHKNITSTRPKGHHAPIKRIYL